MLVNAWLLYRNGKLLTGMCQYLDDGILTYGWLHHDGHSYGDQVACYLTLHNQCGVVY